jgi:hypothetical protein
MRQMASLHALHAHQSRIAGQIGMQGVALGVPRMHANQFHADHAVDSTRAS